MCHGARHNGLYIPSHSCWNRDTRLGQPVVVHTERQLLIYIVIVERAWPAESGTEICIQVIRAPERPFPTFHVDIVWVLARIYARLAVDAEGKHEMCSRAEQAPAVIYP